MKNRKKYQWLHKLMHTKTFVCCNYCTHISSYVFYSFTSSDLDFSTKEIRELREQRKERCELYKKGTRSTHAVINMHSLLQRRISKTPFITGGMRTCRMYTHTFLSV